MKRYEDLEEMNKDLESSSKGLRRVILYVTEDFNFEFFIDDFETRFPDYFHSAVEGLVIEKSNTR